MKNGGFIFSIIIFSTFAVVFGFFIAPALAQDAIQCTPGDVNLNRNLKFVNLASNNIYLGTGKLNFSSTDANLYATNNGGLLLHNANANILIQSNNILFSDDIAGANRLAGIYSADPGSSKKAKSNDRYFIVDGKIEGWKVNALGNLPNGGLCVQGPCIEKWSDVNVAGYGESRCELGKEGALGACQNVRATINITADTGNITATAGNITAGGNISTTKRIIGGELCVPDTTGANCINSWGDVMSSFTGGNINMSSNSLTFGDQTNLVMENGAVFRICKDVNGDGNHDLASNPFTGPVSNDDYSDPNECSTGQGVSKIIAGSGIAISSTPSTGNPISGIGDVTIGLNLAAASFDCQQIDYEPLIERWFTTTTDPNYNADCNFGITNPNLPGANDDISFPTACPDEKIHHIGLAGAEESSPDLAYETQCPINYVVTGIIPPDGSFLVEYKPRESGALICCKLN